MLAFITNLNLTELTIIVVGAVLVFGKDLPKVVMRGLQHLAKLRKAVTQMWNEAGLEQEMRRVRAEIDSEIPKVSSPSQWVAEGKRKLTDPVETWRRNVQSEIEGSVPVEKKSVAKASVDDHWPEDSQTPKPPPPESGERTGEGAIPSAANPTSPSGKPASPASSTAPSPSGGPAPGFKPGPAPTAPDSSTRAGDPKPTDTPDRPL